MWKCKMFLGCSLDALYGGKVSFCIWMVFEGVKIFLGFSRFSRVWIL